MQNDDPDTGVKLDKTPEARRGARRTRRPEAAASLALGRAAQLVIGGAAAAVDRATLAAYTQTIRRRRRRNAAQSLSHDERMRDLHMLAERYRACDLASYFRPPRALDPVQRVVRSGPGNARVIDLAWPSDYTSFLPEFSEHFEHHVHNQTAAARLFVRGRPRAMAILIHGYMAGQYAVEQRVWPIDWLSRVGIDSALFVLPFHGVRANPNRRVPPFPGGDPRMSNEGFRQAAADLRDFMRFLRERGHSTVGVLGMSLGGYLTALACTLECDLAFGVPIIPVASLADLARDQGRLGSRPNETAAQHAALDEVHRVISPLHRSAVVPRERLLVIGAKADRITPMSHARRLAHHFGAPLDAWTGGHLLQYGRSAGFRRIGRLLSDLGLSERRGG